MTALRIFTTASPSLIGAPVQPMSAEDARFWHILADRRKAASALALALAQHAIVQEANGRRKLTRERPYRDSILRRLFSRQAPRRGGR